MDKAEKRPNQRTESKVRGERIPVEATTFGLLGSQRRLAVLRPHPDWWEEPSPSLAMLPATLEDRAGGPETEGDDCRLHSG